MKIFYHLNHVSNPVGLHVRRLLTAAATWILIALALSHSYPALPSGTEADALLRSGWWPHSVTSNTSVTHCAWPGISCDDSRSVVGINMFLCYDCWVGSNFSSMNFSLLPNLASLQLRGNYLHGNFPVQICALPKLGHLDLSSNYLTGPLPPELGNLTKLWYLDLSFNSLHGPILPTLGELKNLTHLCLQGNSFHGSIPPEIGNLTNLAFPSMEENKFSGYIPSEIGNLKGLIELDMSSNSFTGPIPSKIGDLKNLTHLDLSSNNFSGEIPLQLESLVALRHLNLMNNSLQGSVPNFRKLSNLDYLDLSYNHLTGKVPQNLLNVRHAYFEGNEGLEYTAMLKEANALRRSGWWPDLLTSNVSLAHCMWPGISCNDSGRVVKIDIPRRIRYDHGIAPNLSSMNWSLLLNLAFLGLPNSDLTGIIPLQVCALPKLRYLNLSHNHLIGELPLCLQNLAMLEVIDIHTNLLDSPIPPKLGNLKRLIHLDLSFNAFRGTIPSTLGHLDYIDLSYNRLRGKIPDYLAHVRYGAFEGNEGLENADGSERMAWIILMMVLIPLVAILVLGPLIILRRRTKCRQSEIATKNGDFLSIWNYDGTMAYEDIINATEDFDIKYCIGTGGYGSVYRAQLPNGKIVALKKLHRLEAEDPSFDKSFRN